MGGQLKQIAAIRNSDDHLEVFAIGSDNKLWHIWQTGGAGTGWSNWASLGGQVSQITVASNKDSRLEVFAIGKDLHGYHIWQTGGAGTEWSGWASMQNGPIESMSVVRGPSGELRFYWLNATTGEIYETFQSTSGNWTPDTPLSDGNKYQGVVAGETNNGLVLNIFGTDDRFYQRQFNSQSGSWSPRSDVTPSANIPNENDLPPGGILALTGGSTQTAQNRLERLKYYRAIWIGVTLFSALEGNIPVVILGVNNAIQADKAVEKEEEKQGQHDSPPSSDNMPEITLTSSEQESGGTPKIPGDVTDVDPEPPSREDIIEEPD